MSDPVKFWIHETDPECRWREPTVDELVAALEGKICNCLMAEWVNPEPGPHNSWCLSRLGVSDE